MKSIPSTPKKPSKDWRQALRDFIAREAKPVDKFGHQPRLYALTQQVGAGMSYDDDVVYAAAWLHDLGVFLDHRPTERIALAQWDNVKYAVEQAPAILREIAFPEEKIAAVLEAIRTHQASAEPLSVEAVILRDADILEQLGAVGILRAVCKVGRDTRYSTFTEAIAVLQTALERLPASLRLDSARALAADRIALLAAFLKAADQEAGESLF